MSYASVYIKPGDVPNANGKSQLNIISTSDTYEELFLNVKSFTHGFVKVFNLDTLEPVGTLFPSGRIMLRTEYMNE